MGMRAPDGAGLPVQEKAHGALFAGAFGMEVDQDDFFPDLRHVSVGNDEGVIRVGIESEFSHQVQYAHIPEIAVVDIDAAARALGRVVCRAQDAGALVEIGLQLGTRPGVVAEGDDIGPGAEDHVRLLWGDADHIGVFTVYHREGDAVLLLKGFQLFVQCVQPRLAAHIAHRQYFHNHRLASLREIIFFVSYILPHIALQQQGFCAHNNNTA